MGSARGLAIIFLLTIGPAVPAFGEVRQLPPLRDLRLPAVALPPDGVKCVANRDCPSGNCVEGYCCDIPCTGKCQSCALPGRRGTCTPVPEGTDPKRSCTNAVGGHPLCNAGCYGGQCAFPDVGTPCGICASCDGFGRCTETPYDDARCGVVDCSGLDTGCRRYNDLTASRCGALGMCKQPNDPATCTSGKDLYSWADSGLWRLCPTGRILDCYPYGNRLLWKDGAVIRDCRTGAVCNGCPGPPPDPDIERPPPKPSSGRP